MAKTREALHAVARKSTFVLVTCIRARDLHIYFQFCAHETYRLCSYDL